MAALELFFSFLLLFIFFFIIPTRASCPPSSCPGGPTVRFPFRLQSLQLRSCGYAGFDLSCNNQTLQTTISLSNSNGNNFIVQAIDYNLQTLFVNDPNHCLPKRFLDRSFDHLPETPFRIHSLQMYTFLNCSPQAPSFPAMARNISCLSGENHTVVAMPSGEYDNWLQSTALSTSSPSPSSSGLSCELISSVPARAAHELGVNGDARDDGVALTWSTPGCSVCEASESDCGLNSDTSQIVCSDAKAEKKVLGLSRSAKYGIIIGVCIPGILCIFGLISYVCDKIKAYSRRNRPNMDFSTSSQQPAIVIAGLDGATIESYPKTLLGESRRLPKPNDTTCSICLGEYQPKEELRTIPECNHYFHATCVDEWLKMNATCPVCRKSPEGSALITPSSSMSSSSTSLPSP